MTISDGVSLAIHRFFRAVDARDWDTASQLLADQVSIDYTSVFGGEPERVAGGEIVQRWRDLLPGFDATQHFLGPLLGTGEGVVECNVRGFHHLDGGTWMVAGWYTLTLAEDDGRVRIAGIDLAESYETGSRDLVERARQRAGS
ncbi:MAG: hypothetical protein DLM58_08950 [Pseudonocardiales bacterium]|nr:MAG: hypothetical protein DLM58_08950 [Pseudonocardiales bacterium]